MSKLTDDPAVRNEIDRADAVCFTAGLDGASFGAGVIHAYLTADRKPPRVVAGISMGALSAAAMQNAYRRRGSATDEASRWAWFRKYLTELSDRPLDAIWDAIPDPADFFSDMPPIKDGSIPEKLKGLEDRARQDRHLLTRLVGWLASLDVTARSVFRLLTAWVREKERYPQAVLLPGWLAAFGRKLRRVALLLWLAARVALRAPFAGLFREYRFRSGGIRPLLGWWIFLLSSAFLVVTVLLAASTVSSVGFLFAERFSAASWAAGNGALRSISFQFLRWTGWPMGGLLLSVVVWLMLPGAGSKVRLSSWVDRLLAQVGFQRGLVSDFHIRRKVLSLFGEAASEGVGDTPMPALLVAAPLQTLFRTAGRDEGKPLAAYQLWASPTLELVEALRGALSVPGALEPATERGDRSGGPGWVGPVRSEEEGDGGIDLVDAAVVRQNPLPALFSYLRMNPAIADSLASRSADDARVHVVFSVPMGPVLHKEDGTYPEEKANIVDVALLSLRLARRRDTLIEMYQAQLLSKLECVVPGGGAREGTSRSIWPIFSDGIAPDRDLGFANPLKPRHDESIQRAVLGCRATLERLYGETIRRLCGDGGTVPRGQEIDCERLISLVAPGRTHPQKTQGLVEVCDKCTKKLRWMPDEGRNVDSVVPPVTYAEELPEKIRAGLGGAHPRIVLLTSGGVFRGSFHIGMAGALVATGIKPDLIVGASVGTIMGAAIGRCFDGGGVQVLHDLTRFFLHVDERVALTKSLKGAVRELGLRGRSIGLSPRGLQRLIRKGSRADAGYAAVGAPPALIDALSGFLMIPHRQTADVAAAFVGGHFARASFGLLRELKKETIKRLDVDRALMGSELLEAAFRGVLQKEGAPKPSNFKARQPFADAGIGFFCTTTDLGREEAVVLGDDDPFPGEPWDFFECCLASSAFPAVFAPRRESDLFPGIGHPDRRYADGGMFDNLPFLPAIRILAQAQEKHDPATLGDRGRPATLESLERRHDMPDLILVGSLDVNPEEAPDKGGPFRGPLAVSARAEKLQNNVKLRSFQWAAERVHRQVARIVNGPQPVPKDFPFLDSVVDAAVLPVFPVDDEHLNGTFEFCASVGLNRKKVLRSIANGCFQTLAALQAPPTGHSGRAVRGLVGSKRMPPVTLRKADREVREDECPYFEAGRPVACPFAAEGESRGVFDTCRRDRTHRDGAKRAAAGSGRLA